MTSGKEKSRKFGLHSFLPSARDIIFIFLFCSVLAGTLSTRPLADPDIGWHIRTGERILATHAVPHSDPYSSTMQGQPWFAWEWLYDLILGELHRTCGLNGVVWLCAVIVASTFTLLLSQLLRRGTGLPLAILLMLLAEGAAMIHLFARPHIVSWLFSLVWFVALERWEVSTRVVPSWLPWFFPASMLLWVNLHGEWILGLALLAIYALGVVVASFRAADTIAGIRAGHRARAMAYMWIASAAATFVNPYGWRLHAHIYRYLGDPYLINRISEFRSPDFHGWAQRCFALIFLLTVLAFATQRASISVSRFLVVLLAAYMGLYSSRNLPVSSILLVLVIGPILWQEFASLADNPGAWMLLRNLVAKTVGFSERMAAQELRLRGHLWPAACVVGAVVICLQGGRLGSRQVIQAHFDPKTVPARATDFLEKEASSAPIFSPDSWGAYLIYRLYPRRQVVVDDRHDLYGSGRVRSILVAMQGEPGWNTVLNDWNVKTVLLPRGSTLANLLQELPQEWQMTYHDDIAVVLERQRGDP